MIGQEGAHPADPVSVHGAGGQSCWGVGEAQLFKVSVLVGTDGHAEDTVETVPRVPVTAEEQPGPTGQPLCGPQPCSTGSPGDGRHQSPDKQLEMGEMGQGRPRPLVL